MNSMSKKESASGKPSRRMWKYLLILIVVSLVFIVFVGYRMMGERPEVNGADIRESARTVREDGQSESVTSDSFGFAKPATIINLLSRIFNSSDMDAELYVQVLDRETGDPVKGAAIIAMTPKRVFPQCVRTTDESGTARMCVSTGTNTYDIRKDGYTDAAITTDVYDPRDVVRKTVYLNKYRKLRGLIRDDTDAVVPNTYIWLRRTSDDRCAEMAGGTTDQHGVFEANLCPGNYRYMVGTVSYEEVDGEVVVRKETGDDPILITVRGRRDVIRIKGELYDDATNEPIDGGIVILQREGAEQEWYRGTTDTTDEYGRYELQSPVLSSEGLVEISASCYDSVKTRLPLLRDTEQRFYMHRQQALNIQVYDAHGDRMSSGFAVQSTISGPLSPIRVKSLDEICTARYPVTLYATAFARGIGFSNAVTLHRHTPEIRLRFATGGELHVFAFGSTKQLARYRVTLSDSLMSGSADVHNERGFYACRSIPPGSYTLTIEADGFDKWTNKIEIDQRRTTIVRANLVTDDK